MSGTKQAEPPRKNAKSVDDEDPNPLNVEDVRKVIFSLLPIKTLCRYKCISKAFRADAGQAIAIRTARVTDEDVAKDQHVAKLRQLIKEVEPGQTIELAAGRYLLGDDSIERHCDERIRYPSEMREHEENGDFYAAHEAEEAWESYFDDVRWNEWKRGYGDIKIKKAGIRLIGRSGPERTTVVVKAHSSFSFEPVALQIWDTGVFVENIDFEGNCTAISVGNFTTDVSNKFNPIIDTATSKWSVSINKCNFRDVSLRICSNTIASVTDCIVKDDNGGFDGKASVQVGRKAEVHLTRTKISNSGRHAYQTFFEGRSDDNITNNQNGYGGLFLRGDSTAYLDDVEILGNVPAGIVISSRKACVVLCGPLNFARNERGVMVEQGRPSRKRAYPEVSELCGNDTSFYVYKEDKKRKRTENYKSLADKHIEAAQQIFASDGSKEGDKSLKWMLSRIEFIERGRSAIGNSNDHGEIIKHDEGFCSSDCELCQWDFDLPNDD